jgi:hypothetical protein
MDMLRKTLPLLSIMLIAALLAGGCTETGKTDGAVEGAGTISCIENYGETYIIVMEDGTRYAPVNLGEEYRSDGMKVYFRGVILTDAGAPGSPGIPVEIREIGTYVPPEKNATVVLEKV